eukprot:3221190-Lingulodinium_polyedra.AAC.1
MQELARFVLNWDSRRRWSHDGLSDEDEGASPVGALPISFGSASCGQLIRSEPVITEVLVPAFGLDIVLWEPPPR